MNLPLIIISYGKTFRFQFGMHLEVILLSQLLRRVMGRQVLNLFTGLCFLGMY